MFQTIVVEKIKTRVGVALIQVDRGKDTPLFGTVRIHLQGDTWVEDTEVNDGNTYFREFTSKLRVPFIHSIGMCRIRWFLAVLRSFFHSSLSCNFSCHPSPQTILPSSLTPSRHLFLSIPLNLVVPKFIYNTLLGILFFSILCTCPNQRNLFNNVVSIQ